MDITDFDQMEQESADRLFDDFDDNGSLNDIECPNCGLLFDGLECDNCGFDTAFNPYWD